jgi:hypothetical protein
MHVHSPRFEYYHDTKIIPLENTTFEVSSDIYFLVYNLYYFGQNDDLGARAGPIHRDGGSII